MGDGYYYTLSAIAQSFAAIIGLNAIFIIYKLQMLKNYTNEVMEKIEQLIYQDMIKVRHYEKNHANYELSRMSETEKLLWAKAPSNVKADVEERSGRLFNQVKAIGKLSETITDWLQVTLVLNGITIILSLVLLPWKNIFPCFLQYIFLSIVLLISLFALLITIHATLTIIDRNGFYRIEQSLVFVMRLLGYGAFAKNIDTRKTHKLIKAIQRVTKMIDLGIYQTKDGKEYDCNYIPADKIAEAIGPLPKPGQVGSRGVAFKVKAESEQEAKQKLAEAIGAGHWTLAIEEEGE